MKAEQEFTSEIASALLKAQTPKYTQDDRAPTIDRCCAFYLYKLSPREPVAALSVARSVARSGGRSDYSVSPQFISSVVRFCVLAAALFRGIESRFRPTHQRPGCVSPHPVPSRPLLLLPVGRQTERPVGNGRTGDRSCHRMSLLLNVIIIRAFWLLCYTTPVRRRRRRRAYMCAELQQSRVGVSVRACWRCPLMERRQTADVDIMFQY